MTTVLATSVGRAPATLPESSDTPTLTLAVKQYLVWMSGRQFSQQPTCSTLEEMCTSSGLLLYQVTLKLSPSGHSFVTITLVTLKSDARSQPGV